MADTDINYRSFTSVDNGLSLEDPVFHPENPGEFDDIVKFSGASNIQLRSPSIAQGKENSVDINNRSTSIQLLNGEYGLDGPPGFDCCFAIKGGSRSIVISGVVVGRGKHYDIELGGWSDQSTDYSEQIDLSGLMHDDGKPLRVAVARARNYQLGLHAKKDSWWSFLLSLHWHWRKIFG